MRASQLACFSMFAGHSGQGQILRKGGNDPVRSQLTVRTKKRRAGRSRPFADDHGSTEVTQSMRDLILTVLST